jgi:hypothetical protein
MTIKDAAGLFAAEGEEAKEILDALKEDAQDVLDLVLAEAPKNSSRERYRYVREHVFPLIRKLEDEGEQNHTLKDVASKLELNVRDLRKAFAALSKQSRQEHDAEDDEEAGEGDVAPEPGTERHEDAMELLRDPNILERAAQNMERLGHVGEQTAKKLLFVCAVSARAGLPIQPSIHAESSAGKNHLANTALLLLPPEMVIERTAVSAKALFRTEESLSGRVLYLQEVVGSEDADFPIRVLQSAQRLEYEVTEKMPNGSFKTVVYSKEGPVVVVQTTTAIRLFHENDTRVFPIYVDESPEQTKRIVEHAKRRRRNGKLSKEEREAILGVWHDAIRLLEPAEVIIPFSERIEVPFHRVRVRRDIERIFDVIEVVAWLNQHNRERDERDHILAIEEDFHIAAVLVTEPLQSAWKSLTPAEAEVMRAIASLSEPLRNNGFTRHDLEVEDHDKRRVQDALKALTETGYLERDGRRGPRGYRYTVSGNPENNIKGISLRPRHDQEGEDEPEGADADAQGDPDPSRQGEDVEDEGERESRDIARNDNRAIEDEDLGVKEAIALSRAGEAEEDLQEGESDEEGGEPDYVEELTRSGWFRAQTDFPLDTSLAEEPEGEDPVARRLRHEVGIYKSPDWWKDNYNEEPLTPLALTAEDVFKLGPEGEGGEEQLAASWPATTEEMDERLKLVIPLLQSGVQRFWDPGLTWWYDMRRINQPDKEKHCTEAYLRAELWRNEETAEEIWALVALKEGWRVPDTAIELAVWLRTTLSYPMNAVPEGVPFDFFEGLE